MRLKHRGHTGKNEFEEKKLATKFKQGRPVSSCNCIKFKSDLSPKYIGHIYSLRISPNTRTCRSTDSFVVPFYEKETTRKSSSYLGSKISNDLKSLATIRMNEISLCLAFYSQKLNFFVRKSRQR